MTEKRTLCIHDPEAYAVKREQSHQLREQAQTLHNRQVLVVQHGAHDRTSSYPYLPSTHTSQRHTLNKQPLCQEKDRQHRDQRDNRYRHQHIELGKILAAE